MSDYFGLKYLKIQTGSLLQVSCQDNWLNMMGGYELAVGGAMYGMNIWQKIREKWIQI